MLLFVHDHKFRRVNGKIYTTGGLSNETLQRYTRLDNEVVLYTRIIDEQNKSDQWSLIKENIQVQGDPSLAGKGLEESVKAADGVIIRLPSFLGNKACKIVKKYNKPCMIEMVGCAWDSLWNHGVKGKIVAPFVFLLTRKYVKDAPFVLYVTDKYLQSRYPTLGKSIGCSDVVIEDISRDILCKRLEKIRNRKGKRIIGTIGAVDVRYKGQEYVIKALKLLKDKGVEQYEYQIVGNGDDSYLKNLCKKYDVDNQVIFYGGIPHEMIFDWLDTLDIYIQPSLTEGLPRALVEAQSRGLPCFGSRIGGIPELLHEETVFDINNNPEKNIAEKLLDLDIDKEVTYSEFDFLVAQKFQQQLLDQKRSAFYDMFYSFVKKTSSRINSD